MSVSCVNQTFQESSNHGVGQASLSYVINMVALPAVCAFGIVGNMLNLAILTRRKLKKSIRTLEQAANLCLIYLATSDLLFCVFAFSTTLLPVDNVYDQHGLSLKYALYSAGIINVFIMESTMLTVAMSLERYLAICFPLRQDIYLTTSRIKLVIPFTFLFSVGFNIPVFMRYEILTLCVNEIATSTNGDDANMTDYTSDVHNNIRHHEFNEQNLLIIIPNITHYLKDSISNFSLTSNKGYPRHMSISSSLLSLPTHHPSSQTSPYLSTSTISSSSSSDRSIPKTLSMDVKTIYTTQIVPLGGSPVYDTAYRIVWAFVGNFIPLFLLLYFNFCLCRKIYRSYKQRKQLGRQIRTRNSSHILTMTLVAIVVLFLILVAPSEVTLQISHLASSNDTPIYRNIEAVLNLMQSINFSGNFILYCIISPYFRKTLKYTILCGCYNVYHVSRQSKQEFHTSLL